MIPVARRRLLQAFAWLSFGLFSGVPTARAKPSLATVPSESLDVIGLAYLEAFPEERGSLLHSWRHSAIGLRARVRGDFANGNVVWVRGFLLARSEARHCAARRLRRQLSPSSSET